MIHKIYYFTDNSVLEHGLSSDRMKYMMHVIGESKLWQAHNYKRLTTDLDGVFGFHDLAKVFAEVVGGKEAVEQFGKYARLNKQVMDIKGWPAYCFHAPVTFCSQLAKGLSPEINRIIGSKVSTIPGSEEYFDMLRELGYKITVVTAANQDAAEVLSRRCGLNEVIGNVFSTNGDGTYDGTIDRFVGGSHKRDVVSDILGIGHPLGIHVCDSTSDIETAEAYPSLAFNPANIKVLMNANVSAIGPSKRGLVPFFDTYGRYDDAIKAEDLPRKVIVMEKYDKKIGAKLFAKSCTVKEKAIGRRVKTIEAVIDEVTEELRELGIPFQSRHTKFMQETEFDLHADEQYRLLFPEKVGDHQ